MVLYKYKLYVILYVGRYSIRYILQSFLQIIYIDRSLVITTVISV